MSGGTEDGDLIRALQIFAEVLTGADRIRAADIIDRAASLKRPLKAGWQAEAREIIERHRAETDRIAQALGFNTTRGGDKS